MSPAKPAPPKSVGLWIRVSTEDQAKGESPEHHEARGRAYAAAKGWNVVTVYHLEGVSGKAVKGHPEAKRMMKDIETGSITGLIFSKLARLARNTRELLDFADYFQHHSADLVSLQESIDTSTPAGRLFYTMIAAMAQWEREEIASRVAASVPIRAQMGKSLGGPPPFGYEWKDGRLVPNPDEAPVRRLVHELFVECERKKAVADRLNGMGHRMRGGKRFTGSTIDVLLDDPTPKGLHRANYMKHEGGTRWVRKPETEWIFSQVEPILPAALWDRCREILTAQAAKRKPKAKPAVQLFGGLTWCACGQKMYVKSNTPKYVCQKCHNKIPIEDLDAIFLEQLRGFMLSPDQIREHLEKADETISSLRSQATALETERAKVARETDALFRLYMDGGLTSQGFAQRNRPLEERLGQIDEELPRLQAEADYLSVNLLSESEALTEAQDLSSRWPSLDHADKRRIVENLVERITIGEDEVTIDLFYLPVHHSADDEDDTPSPKTPPTPSSPPPPRSAHPHRATSRSPAKSEACASSEIMANGPRAARGSGVLCVAIRLPTR